MDMEKIYSKVAEDNGVSTGEVRRAIQEAIKDAYTNPQNSSETVRAYQRRVPCKGEIPTPEEHTRATTNVVPEEQPRPAEAYVAPEETKYARATALVVPE